MYSFLVVSFVVIGNVYNVNGLSTSKSPGDQFDLSNWKLTLPDSSASEKSPSQLESDYESKYFYTDSDDGSMTFYCPGNGGKTDTAKYPRSELRQLCNPSNSKADRYNWKASSSGGYHYVDGKYRIGKLDSSSRKVVIQQIHAYDGPPLVKIQYEKGKVYALIKEDEDGDNEDKVTLGSVDDDEIFQLKTVMSSGYLKVYFKGSQKTNVKVRDYWSGYTNYFKAGNYIQSSSSSAYAYIHIYYLKVYTPSSKCSYDSSFTYDDDAASTSGNAAVVASAVSIVALLLIAGGIFGFCYWKKSKSGKASFKDSVDESAATKQSGDTPMVSDNNETGQDTPNSTGAYNMEEIEISVPVEDEVNNEETQ